ncbi:BRCT domain-containing protein [Heracleum sosnowskyi]|uniref:BRCT domain-containing protein n=1 Tax=Heracleum sosnowskyi TaxID=360622 RepID=A0AAD8MZ72_9APIA|nr:BRCT domain-containing protein [Heracleum sosnowskyi]
MRSFGDDDNDDEIEEDKEIVNPQADVSDADTEFMDTQPSPLLGCGLFDNTVPSEDDETQGACLAGETQAVDDLGAEDLCTQLFDDCDTEVVVETDDDGTKQNEVLSDTEALSDVVSAKRVDSRTVEEETMLQTGVQKQNGGESKEVQIIEECNTGPVLQGFTSLRVAAIRSSGLAARNMPLKRTDNTSCSNTIDGQHEAESSVTLNSLGQLDQRHNLEEHDDKIKGSSSENKCTVGNSAVRKLLNEDISNEKGLDINFSNTGKEENFPPVCSSERELAGLSYVDSQEPGEASQTIALDFVDKFLKVNDIEFDQEAEIIKSTGGKSKALSGAKGTQSLAKRANHICSASGGTFDWDDYQEDEGGGEFFSKKKEAFFKDGRKAHQSFPQPRDLKRRNPNNCWAVKENSDKVEQQDISCNVASVFYSNSKLLSQKPKQIDKSVKVAGKSIGENLIKRLDDARDEMVETGTKKDNPDLLDVGVDTQLAADAMEALCYGVGLNGHDSNLANQDVEVFVPGTAKGKHRKKLESDKDFVQKRPSRNLRSAVTTRESNQTKMSGPGLTRASKQCHKTEDMCNLRCALIDDTMNERELERGVIGENGRCLVSASSGKKALQKQHAQEQLGTYLPIACRTRQKASNQTQRDTKTSIVLRKGIDNLSAPIAPKRKRSRASFNTLAREKCTELKSIGPGHLGETKVTNQKLSKEEIHGNSKIKFTQMKSGIKRKILASGVSDLASRQRQSKKGLVDDTSVEHNPCYRNAIGASEDLDVFKAQIDEFTAGKSHSAITAAEEANVNPGSRVSLKDICTPKSSAYMTPKHYGTPINEASPICMDKEYHRQSSRKKLLRSPLKREVNKIIADGPKSAYTSKDLRKRRDITQVHVLFSQHLDGDLIKQQKKVLFRLGASVASSIPDATHFIADEFVRTRNMLEAIAYGKPVVTHFWLERCGQASCLIDERNFILRDAKKEKEIGFSLPDSLARACQHPLLEGCRVLITRNAKPGKDILASLVKSVHGMVIERIGRSAPKDEVIPSDLIVLSCEEDYADCVPFLEKGASVYSSELLLNGIVIQKLEYERHQLFAENVRKVHSTVRLRRDGDEFIPVAKCK